MNTLPIGLIGDIGGGEILLIAAAILMLFGGERLPSIARTIGKTVEGLRKASQDFKNQLLNSDNPPPPERPEHSNGRASRPGEPMSPDTTPPKETLPRDPAG